MIPVVIWSKFSELHGAINFPTSGILRVTPEGLYLIQTSTTNDIFTTIHPGEANRDDEDIHFYVKANARMGRRVTDWSRSIPVLVTLIDITIPHPQKTFSVRGMAFIPSRFWPGYSGTLVHQIDYTVVQGKTAKI
ncbi:hypothetical protein J3A83DRAFT_4404623 [Scleroderma citrinum]